MRLAPLLAASILLAATARAQQAEARFETLRPAKLATANGTTLTLQPDDSILLGGTIAPKETVTLELPLDGVGWTALRVEALADPRIAAQGPGLAGNGNFVLNEASLEQAQRGSDGFKPMALSRATADFEQQGFGAQMAVDALPATGWAIAPQFGVDHQIVLEAARDLGLDGGATLRLRLDFPFGAAHVIGRMRIAATRSARPVNARRDDRALVEAQARVAPAIQRGVRWLLDQQEMDGLWAIRSEDVKQGMTALAGYTLLKCGVRPNHPAIQRAAARIRCEPATHVYAAGFELMFLAELDDASLKPRIEETAGRLQSWQQGPGGFSYPGPYAADLSNGQYAALGLRAAAKRGVKVLPEVWTKLGDETLTHQEKAAGAYASAGFGYYPGGPAYGSITAGGTCVLKIVDEELAKQGATKQAYSTGWRRGVAWLDRCFAPDANPGQTTWVWYWLYGIERVGGLCKVSELGGRSWYREGARFIVDHQKADGSWDGDGGPQPSTCFALLFLARATSSISGLPAPVEDQYGADDPAVDASLRATGDTPLVAWIASFGGATKALSWPADGDQGPRVSKVVYAVPGRTVLPDARVDPGRWRYATEPPGDGFEQPGFDDSKWKSGPGAIGAKLAASVPVRSEWSGAELWARREVELDEVPLVEPQLFVAASPEPADPASKPALACLFDEEPGFAALVNEASAGGTIAVKEQGAQNGRLCVAVTPQQAYRGAMPGWSFPIVEKPERGEYRYLRFAWRKEGGGGLMIQIARNGGFDAATPRVNAGPNEVKWPSTELAKDAPREWKVETVDLFKLCGATTLTGLAFTPMSGGPAYFDAIYLARSPADFDAIPKGTIARKEKDAAKEAAAPAAAPPAAGSIELFVNGARVFASDSPRTGYDAVPTLRPLSELLKPGRNVIALHAVRGAAVAAVDVGIADQRVVATVPGDPTKPRGSERFAAKIEFDRNGVWPLRALVHVVPPPEVADGHEVIVASPQLAVSIREANDADLLAWASDAGRNLLGPANASVVASSRFGDAFQPAFAADNLASRGWLSADGDKRPKLSIELRRPARADTLLVAPISQRGFEVERTKWRVRRLQVELDGGRSGSFELLLPPDGRKGVVRLPKPIVVRRIDLTIVDASDVPPGKNALGLGEVELQLRK